MGLLKDEQPVQQGQQPIEQPPMDGQQEPENSKSQGEGVKQTLPGKFQAIKDKAVKFMYGDKFDQLIKMFQDAGAEGFARSVAVAVNGAINHVKEAGEVIDHKMAAVLGMDLYMMIVEDMATGQKDGMPIAEGLTLENIQDALKQTIKMYADSNADVTEEDINRLMQEIDKQKGAKDGIA